MTIDTIPARIHVLAKPPGAICNLGCSYCFFLDKELLYPGSRFRMSDEVLENYIRQLVESHRSDNVTVAWQGGEPTLVGIDFFRRAIAYQDKYKKPGMTFQNTMHRDDRVGESQPIAFDGDAWPGYVPLRLPWTLCIRERVPAGSVAVLINRAHTYPDLALPIDPAQARVFTAIDANRSIDILRIAADVSGKEQARKHFERLWQYDQILFDATGSR
jgi:hypothetical protein